MWRVLRSHPKIVIGNEWMAGRAHDLTRDMFEPSRFFAPVIGADCGYDIAAHPETKDYLPLARERYAEALWIGDKIPYLYKHFDRLYETFPEAEVIFMLRDPFEVAASYKKRHLSTSSEDADLSAGSVVEAIRDWNESLQALQQDRHRDPFVIHYREISAGLGHWTDRVNLKFSDFTPTLAAERFKMFGLIEKREPILTAAEVGLVNDTADLESYRKLFAAQHKFGFRRQPPYWWDAA